MPLFYLENVIKLGEDKSGDGTVSFSDQDITLLPSMYSLD